MPQDLLKAFKAYFLYHCTLQLLIGSSNLVGIPCYFPVIFMAPVMVAWPIGQTIKYILQYLITDTAYGLPISHLTGLPS